MIGVALGKTGFLIGVVLVVGWVIRMNLPAITCSLIRVIEAIPHFDLHENLSPSGFTQHTFKPRPVFIVPEVEVVFAVVKSLERIHLVTLVFAIAHRVANHIPPNFSQTVKLGNQFLLRPLKQIVIITATQQHHRSSPVTPIPFIIPPRPKQGICFFNRMYCYQPNPHRNQKNESSLCLNHTVRIFSVY